MYTKNLEMLLLIAHLAHEATCQWGTGWYMRIQFDSCERVSLTILLVSMWLWNIDSCLQVLIWATGRRGGLEAGKVHNSWEPAWSDLFCWCSENRKRNTYCSTAINSHGCRRLKVCDTRLMWLGGVTLALIISSHSSGWRRLLFGMGMGRLAVMDPNTLGDLEIFLSWRLQGGFMKLGTPGTVWYDQLIDKFWRSSHAWLDVLQRDRNTHQGFYTTWYRGTLFSESMHLFGLAKNSQVYTWHMTHLKHRMQIWSCV